MHTRIRLTRVRRRAVAAIVLLAAAAGAFLTAPVCAAAEERPVVSVTVVGRYRLQSNPWVNLHQRLLYEAQFDDGKPPAALTGDDLENWKTAVFGYRAFFGQSNPILDKGLIELNTALSAADGWTLPEGIPAAPASALRTAMPLYRAAQWDEDDRANRFWIAVAEPLLELAGEELVEAHTRAYGFPFPKHIRVDVTSCAWEFGSYTVGEGEDAHAVIASVVPGNQGFASLEMLMHEPSHAIVAPASGAIGADLARAAKELGVKPRFNLWHAILFYTSGELTRRALARRGVADYRPVILGMYTRGFAAFRRALETHWQAYLDGKETREAAMREIVRETSAAKP